MLELNPELQSFAIEVFGRHAPNLTSKDGETNHEMNALGLLSIRQRQQLQQQVWVDVIQPCAEKLGITIGQ